MGKMLWRPWNTPGKYSGNQENIQVTAIQRFYKSGKEELFYENSGIRRKLS